MLSRQWKKQDANTVYDFVIVGSGYGGAITAARLANAGLNPKPKICLLERGKEWEPGTFPDTQNGWIEENRSGLNPLGLYDVLNYDDISIIKGNGLGGTSLVNANVAIVPDDEVFGLDGWPKNLTREELLPFYEKARSTLDANPHPRLFELLKVKALKKRADQIGVNLTALDLAVNFTIDGVNPHGVPQKPCTDCGDCVTGCNTGAKNTLYMNYIPMANNANAQGLADVHIFTQMTVDWVEPNPGGGWKVHGKHVKRLLNLPAPLPDIFDSDDFDIVAKNVILSAGSVGSTEILMRSANKRGLKVSPMIGTRFGGNGDFFGLAYNGEVRCEVLGFGTKMPNPNPDKGPGPTITAAIRYNPNGPINRRFTIEDLRFATALVRGAQGAFALLGGEDTDAGDEIAEAERRNRDILGFMPYHPNGALNHTMLYLCMGYDDARGHFRWDSSFFDQNGHVSVVWPGAGGQPTFGLMNEEIRRHARTLGGAFLANPLWNFAGLKRLITAHPLGGCPMGDDWLTGVTDEFGRVYSGDGEVHEGLMVADGSLLPSALGVNPLLTISAVSERIAIHKIRDMQGQHYPKPSASVGFSGLDPVDIADRSEQELERIFESAPTLGIEAMMNSDEHHIDSGARQVVDRRYWKGFFPKGHVLNQLSSLVYTGFRKHFWKNPDGRFAGKTSDTDIHIIADNTLEEFEIKEQTGDLKPGKYIRLNYENPEWRGFYDVFKVINKELLIGRVYMGTFPNGLRQFTFPMTTRYDYSRMTAAAHAELFANAAVPTKAELQGSWRMDTISNANQASGVAFLRFDNKPDGRLEARYQLMGVVEGLVLPTEMRNHFQLNDFTQFRDEIRKLDSDLMIGKWVTDAPLPAPFTDLGIFHVTKDPATGKEQFGFHYLLYNVDSVSLPVSRLLEPILGAQVPSGTGMTFDETMEGWYFPGQFAPSQDRAGDLTIAKKVPANGVPAGSVECKFRVKMTVADVNDFIDGPEHEARLSGSIRFSNFEDQGAVDFGLDDKRSFFNYLRVNPATGEAEMRYHLEFSNGSRRFALDGRKYMQKDEAGLVRTVNEVLDDYTTLYTHVYEITGGNRRELGTGLLKFRTFENLAAIGNLVGFLSGFQITGSQDPRVQMMARLKFLAFTGQFVQLEYDPLAPVITTGGPAH